MWKFLAMYKSAKRSIPKTWKQKFAKLSNIFRKSTNVALKGGKSPITLELIVVEELCWWDSRAWTHPLRRGRCYYNTNIEFIAIMITKSRLKYLWYYYGSFYRIQFVRYLYYSKLVVNCRLGAKLSLVNKW